MKFEFKTEKYFHNNKRMKTYQGVILLLIGILIVSPIAYGSFIVTTSYDEMMENYWGEPFDETKSADIASAETDYYDAKNEYFIKKEQYLTAAEGEHSAEMYEVWYTQLSEVIDAYNGIVDIYNIDGYYYDERHPEVIQLMDQELIFMDAEEITIMDGLNVVSQFKYDCRKECIAEYGDSKGFYKEDRNKKIEVKFEEFTIQYRCSCDSYDGLETLEMSLPKYG